MSSLGPINWGPQYDMDEFGKTNWYEPASVSQSMQEKIDAEVRKLIEEGYQEAINLVKKNRKSLDAVAEKLLETETLDRDQFEQIVGKKVNGKEGKESTSKSTSKVKKVTSS
jgi:cell division protease FtsH